MVGIDPLGVVLIEVQELFTEGRQTKMVIRLGGPLYLAASLSRGLA